MQCSKQSINTSMLKKQLYRQDTEVWQSSGRGKQKENQYPTKSAVYTLQVTLHEIIPWLFYGVAFRGLLAYPVLLELSPSPAASPMLMCLSFLQCTCFFPRESGSFSKLLSLLVSISDFHFLMFYGDLPGLVISGGVFCLGFFFAMSLFGFFFKSAIRGFDFIY